MSDKVAAVPESFTIRACRAFAQLGDPLFHTVYWLFWKDSCASSQGARGVSLISVLAMMVLVTVIPTLRLNGASPMMVGMPLGSCPISPLREYFV